MTPAQLAEDIERRNREAQAVFSVAAGDRTGLNPVVAEALASPQHASGQSPLTQIATQVAQQSVSQPVPVGTPAINPNAPDSKFPVQAPETESRPQSFADLIMQNDAVRLRNKEAFDRREKADKARLTIAAVTDALASLGNLVGTTHGAFSQPQTYQVPFVHEDAEKARAEARNTANMLLRNDQSLRLAERREDMANRGLDRQLVVQQAIADRQAAKSQADLELERERQKGKMELEDKRQEGRIDLKKMDLEYKGNKDQMLADLRARGINISAGRLAEMVRHNHAIEAIRENGGGSGNVGAYTTYVEYDEYGRVVKRWRVPGNGGSDSSSNGDNAPWASGNNDNAPWAQ